MEHTRTVALSPTTQFANINPQLLSGEVLQAVIALATAMQAANTGKENLSPLERRPLLEQSTTTNSVSNAFLLKKFDDKPDVISAIATKRDLTPLAQTGTKFDVEFSDFGILIEMANKEIKTLEKCLINGSAFRELRKPDERLVIGKNKTHFFVFAYNDNGIVCAVFRVSTKLSLTACANKVESVLNLIN
ncbi:hypothetical protein M3Y98_01054500 [Aphelenchoides besseyi]|nr:hypothetical protein M3Y98_01054500 [Aphelenchoides besseyi]